MNDRLNVEITEEQAKSLKKLLPHGIRARIFRQLVDQIIELISRGKSYAIGALLDGKIGLGYSNLEKEKEDELEEDN